MAEADNLGPRTGPRVPRAEGGPAGPPTVTKWEWDPVGLDLAVFPKFYVWIFVPHQHDQG